MNKKDVIDLLKMVKHIEGGYFCETYKSSLRIETDRQPSERILMTSMHYMLTDDQRIGYFNINKSDIVHYFNAGSPITYLIIHPDVSLEKVILGPDIIKGHTLQMVVKGGCWKACFLESGEFGLISEAVSPGFDYKDAIIGNSETFKSLCPNLWQDILPYIKPFDL